MQDGHAAWSRSTDRWAPKPGEDHGGILLVNSVPTVFIAESRDRRTVCYLEFLIFSACPQGRAQSLQSISLRGKSQGFSTLRLITCRFGHRLGFEVFRVGALPDAAQNQHP